MDVYSRKIVAWTVHDEQTSEHAADLIQQACIDEKVNRHELTLHSDNGTPMKGVTMLAMLEILGVIPSFSRPSVSDDNPYSESLFKTLKYHPTFPVTAKFENIFDTRRWVISFVEWYNNQHMHSGLKFITPHQRHVGDDDKVLKQRHQVYLEAQSRHPERWARHTRNWQLPNEVTLNPNKKGRQQAVEEKCDSRLAA